MSQMIRINLLDWREERREQRRRQFLSALTLSALAAVAVVYAILYAYGNAIEAQQARNQYLENAIAAIEEKIQKIEKLEETRRNLIRRMHVIEQLQQSRARVVHYFDQLVATIPDGVYLTSLGQDGDITTVHGVAQSNTRVSQYMLNLARSTWFENPQLVVIKSRNANRRRLAAFTLKFKTVPPKTESKQPDN